MTIVGLKPRVTLSSGIAPAFLRHRDIHAEVVTPARIHSVVRLTVGKGDIVLEETPWFHNLLTTTALNGIGTTEFDALTPYCHIGAGTQPVAQSDTNLQTFLGSTNTVQTSVTSARSVPPYYGRYRRTFRIPAGTGTGTVAEVGLSSQATTGGLMARALVQDQVGNPAQITKRSDEWLDVTYEFRLLPDHLNPDGSPNDGMGTIVALGTTVNYIMRPANVTNSIYWLGQDTKPELIKIDFDFGFAYSSTSTIGPVTGTPTAYHSDLYGGNFLGSDVTAQHETYVNGSFALDALLTIGTNRGNATGGLGALVFFSKMGAYQVEFNPAVPKTNLVTFTLGIRFSWGNP